MSAASFNFIKLSIGKGGQTHDKKEHKGTEDYITVSCENGKLVITPDTARAEMEI